MRVVEDLGSWIPDFSLQLAVQLLFCSHNLFYSFFLSNFDKNCPRNHGNMQNQILVISRHNFTSTLIAHLELEFINTQRPYRTYLLNFGAQRNYTKCSFSLELLSSLISVGQYCLFHPSFLLIFQILILLKFVGIFEY